MFEITSSNSGVNMGSLPAGLPAGRLSVKGCGRFSPTPDGFETLPDGMVLQFRAHALADLRLIAPNSVQDQRNHRQRVACPAHSLSTLWQVSSCHAESGVRGERGAVRFCTTMSTLCTTLLRSSMRLQTHYHLCTLQLMHMRDMCA
jgi:hypothetical protein